MVVRKNSPRPTNRQIVRKATRRNVGTGNTGYKALVGGRPRVSAAAKAMGRKKVSKLTQKTKSKVRARTRAEGGGGGGDELFGEDSYELDPYTGAGFGTTSNIGMQGKAYKLSAEGFASGFAGDNSNFTAPTILGETVEGGGGGGGGGGGKQKRRPNKGKNKKKGPNKNKGPAKKGPNKKK